MNKFQLRMKAAFDKMEAIRKKAEAEGRALTEEEIQERANLKAEIEQTEREMQSFEAEEELRSRLFGEGTGESRSQTAGNPEGGSRITVEDQPIYRGSPASALGQQLLDIRTMSRPDIFGGNEVRDARSRLEQVEKRNQAKEEERAKKEGRAAATGGFTVGVPTDGGFFLQGETSVDLMTNGFNNSEILPRTASRTLGAGSQFVEIYGIDETSRKTGSRGGGIRVYTNKELGEFTASKTKFSKIRIEPTKLTGLYNASGEMMRNVTFLGQEMRQLFGEEFAFKCQDLCYRGSGVGEAMGIMAAGCRVEVAKETGQKAATILTANLSKMWARFVGRNPVWFINRDCGPELDQLSITAGTGALEPRFVTYDAQGIMRIKGAPVIPIEQCETVGTAGDILLADWSQYVTANKGDINEAMSIHVNFLYDQETYRFIYYFDGQPRWSSAITPFKGSNTVSPFVTLATRS
ncbi:MAG: Phage capsid family protein [Syntrophorhabdaceae bacterium PtaU1.Bin034]|nr:MAG: Phage capsid family protein [Syntrophorhabdaceae bacterium PtaU1.Bin034]